MFAILLHAILKMVLGAGSFDDESVWYTRISPKQRTRASSEILRQELCFLQSWIQGKMPLLT